MTLVVYIYIICGYQTSCHQEIWHKCWYRFSWKAISKYMSLSLARLCGEWRLVRTHNFQNWKIMLSESRWRNRKAVEEGFSESEAVEEGFSESEAVNEIGKPFQKAESRWRTRKAVEEDFFGFLGNEKAVEENQILSKENLGSRFDTKISTSCVHGFMWLVFQFFNCS